MGNRLSKVGLKFQMKFTKVDGTPFMGQLLDIPDTSRVSNFLSPRRYLRTQVNTIIKPTDVVNCSGTKFIVGEHGTGFYKEPIYKHFKLFEVTSLEDWYASVEDQNPITGIKELVRQLQTEQVYLSLQPKGTQEDSIKIAEETYTAVINREVGRNDQLGNLMVTSIDPVLGIFLVNLKEK